MIRRRRERERERDGGKETIQEVERQRKPSESFVSQSVVVSINGMRQKRGRE